MEEELSQFIAAQTGSDSVTVTLKYPIAGGGSRDTWRLTATIDGGEQELVMRKDLETEIFDHALTRQQEFNLLQVAYENNVIVPRPRWLCMDESVLGKPFFLMDYVPGVSIGVKVVHAPQLKPLHPFAPVVLGQQLAAIHAIDLDDERLAFLPRPTEGKAAARQALDGAWQTFERVGAINPAIEFGLRWLEQNAPDTSEFVLVHGDYRIGNFIVGEQGLHAIIDWEFTHIGDPHEDAAWGCVRDWRFGNIDQHFGGISDRESYVKAYEAASGRTLDRDILDYWEIMGNMNWAVTCLSQAERFLSGNEPSVEFASLGRRSAEMQFEFLSLIERKL